MGVWVSTDLEAEWRKPIGEQQGLIVVGLYLPHEYIDPRDLGGREDPTAALIIPPDSDPAVVRMDEIRILPLREELARR